MACLSSVSKAPSVCGDEATPMQGAGFSISTTIDSDHPAPLPEPYRTEAPLRLYPVISGILDPSPRNLNPCPWRTGLSWKMRRRGINPQPLGPHREPSHLLICPMPLPFLIPHMTPLRQSTSLLGTPRCYTQFSNRSGNMSNF